jgi:formamidopyrimidine-DNA glycosylase
MMELPELLVLKKQIEDTLVGKKVAKGKLGNSPHKFVWYNRTHSEFAQLVQHKTIGSPTVKGRWMFIPIQPGYVLALGEYGGKQLYHEEGSDVPEKYHLMLHFTDRSSLSLQIQMWGAIELFNQGEELKRKYVKNMAPDPASPEFTLSYFQNLLNSQKLKGKRSVKSLLTQDQLVPGIGNSILQDILFHAKLHPKHAIQKLDQEQANLLYYSILSTLEKVVKLGGRNDEIDLYGLPGQYKRLLDSGSVGQPCPVCKTLIEKSNYLGGSCYFCPTCQT